MINLSLFRLPYIFKKNETINQKIEKHQLNKSGKDQKLERQHHMLLN